MVTPGGSQVILQTTGDLITFVLRSSGINGVGQTPLAEDCNTGLDFLRMLIGAMADASAG